MAEQGPESAKTSNLADFLWPFGGTFFGLFVIRIAMAQYQAFFNQNEWLLPLSVILTAACWVVPLVLHNRARRIYSAILKIKRGGAFVLAAIVIMAIAGLFFGGRTLLRFHLNHLRALNQPTPPGNASPPSVSPPSPQAPVAKIPSPRPHLLVTKAYFLLDPHGGAPGNFGNIELKNNSEANVTFREYSIFQIANVLSDPVKQRAAENEMFEGFVRQLKKPEVAKVATLLEIPPQGSSYMSDRIPPTSAPIESMREAIYYMGRIRYGNYHTDFCVYFR